VHSVDAGPTASGRFSPPRAGWTWQTKLVKSVVEILL